jgi:peptidoglycan/xylan/chitin deacetylase (PgdA/CDA1 family)
MLTLAQGLRRSFWGIVGIVAFQTVWAANPPGGQTRTQIPLHFWEWDSPSVLGSVTAFEPLESVDGVPGGRMYVQFQRGLAAQPKGSLWYGEVEFTLPTTSFLRNTDWNTRYRVSVDVRIGPGLVNAFRHHRARLFLVDHHGKRQYLPNNFIGLRPPETNGWIELHGRPATNMPMPLGFTDAGFRADQIVSIGVNVEAGGKEGEFQEDWIELRNLVLEDIGTQEVQSLLPDAQVIREEPLRAKRLEQRWRRQFGTAPHEGRSIYGVNLAWPSTRAPDGHLFQLYGSYLEARWTAFGQHWDLARNPQVVDSLRKDFREIRELFGPQAIVRIFLFADLRSGIDFDKTGVPVGFTPIALQSMDTLFRLALEEQVALMPVVFDFLMADGKSSPHFPGDWLGGEAAHLITNPRARAAMVDLIGQLAARYLNHPALLVWDIMNEPENAVAVVTPEHWIDLQIFLRDAVDAVQAQGELATVGHRNPVDARDHFRGVLRTSLGQVHYYPNLETRPAPFGLDTPQEPVFGQVPGGWGEAPARPGQIDDDMQAGRNGNSAYFLFWSWRGDDENADGFKVRAYRDEIGRALRNHGPIPYVFTMDDFPMWFVTDPQERLDAYQVYRERLDAHGVKGVLFLNGAGLDESHERAREWSSMEAFRKDGHLLANHGARHKPLSQVTWEEFWQDALAGEKSLNESAPGWQESAYFYRFPNSDWGSQPEFSCQQVTKRLGATILPVSADLKDFSYAERYHHALDTESRSAIAQEAFDILEQGVENVRTRRIALSQSAEHPEIFIMHSTRFARDQMDDVLTALEKRGVRWISPLQAKLDSYRAKPGRCVPDCRLTQACR